ncbi:MAG: hypothetical protein E2O49_04225, partial [Gammaproteobacteria bacterium]
MSSANIIIAALSVLLLLVLVVAAVQYRKRQALALRFQEFNEHLHEVSADASIGRRMAPQGDPDAAVLAETINRLFDALGERDQKIQGRDRLFRDFSRTLPEIVIIHDEKILLANESAAGLVGLEPAQLV